MDYKEMEVWKKSGEMVKMIFEITDKKETVKEKVLVQQILRSAISVPSNIAEGIGRQYKKDTIRFLNVSRGSLFETETLLILLSDLKMVNQNECEKLMEKIIEIKKLLHGTINYYKNSTLK
jgi:four helix bundle protein